MAVVSKVGWPVWLLIGAAIAVGLGTGVFFLFRTGSDGEQTVTVVATITAAASATTAQPVASPTSQPPLPTNEPTQPSATEAPPTVEPTPDTRVAIRDLPTRDQIQLGADGKYFIADRGDGCAWREHSRLNDPDVGLEVILWTDCPVDFAITFRPNSGEVFMLVS